MIDLSNLAAGEGLIFNGISAGDALGAGIGGATPVAFDFNGDGVDDIILGAPGVSRDATDNSGQAYLIYGRTDGNFNTDLTSFTANDGVVLMGELGSYGGGVVAPVADVNGDGLDDLLIGAVGYNSLAGRAYLVFGSDSAGATVDLASPGSAAIVIDGAAGARIGTGLVPLGDIDGDGMDDFGVGGIGDTLGGAYTGSIFALLGAQTLGNLDTSALGANDGFAFTGNTGSGRIGRHIATGDLNGDGNPDVVAGTADGPPNVGIFFSSDPPTTTNQAFGTGSNVVIQVSGESASRTPVAVGDFDGDGEDDLLVGIPGLNGNRGGIYAAINTDLLSDTTLGADKLLFQGESANDQVGNTVSNIGDFNGDGVDDIGIGSGNGTAGILFGNSNLEGIIRDGDPIQFDRLTADNGLRFTTENVDALYAFTGGYDLNGDSLADVMVRQPDADGGAGTVFVVFGRLSSPSSDETTAYRWNGGALAETFSGLGLNDTVFGNGGADTIGGGDGDDLIAGGDDDDSLSGDGGNDSGYGQAGNDELFGGAGNDNLRGNLGDDMVYGGAGPDTLRGHVGEDSIFGGAGPDLIFSGGGNDIIFATDDDSADTLNGNSGADSVEGGAGDDLIRGQAGLDTLLGGAGNDTLRGMQGNDVIFGGGGNDLLSGGPANDTLTGGADSDIFEFTQGQGSDTVSDFNLNEDLFSFVGLTFADLNVTDTGDGARITIASEGDSPTLAVLLTDINAADLNSTLFVGG